MSQVIARLEELGFTLPTVSAPAGAYVPAVISGNLVYTAGQLPFVDGALPATGKVGSGSGADTGAALVDPADAKRYAELSALNALAAVAAKVLASAGDTSPEPSPTLPVWASAPPTNGSWPAVKTRLPVTIAGM